MREIGVVIPTYNRAELLEPCLQSLLLQTLDAERFEICVVNNGSSDATPDVVASLAARHPQHRLTIIDEPQLGLSRARNRGLDAVEAPLIAYTDDDATVPPDWLERYVTRFATLGPEVAKIGGEIEPVWDAPRPNWLTDSMLPLISASSGLAGAEARFCTPQETLVECNSCYRRDILKRLGGFPVELGRKGANLLSGDGLIDQRIVVEGGKFFFDPAIVVYHHIHAERLTTRWFRRRYFWQGITDYISYRYLERHGIALNKRLSLDMPLREDDWAFVNSETEVNLEKVLLRLRSLGFVLAMSGVMGEVGASL